MKYAQITTLIFALLIGTCCTATAEDQLPPLSMRIDPTERPEDFDMVMADIVRGWWGLVDETSTDDAFAGQHDIALKVLQAIDDHIAHYSNYDVQPGPGARYARSISQKLVAPEVFDQSEAISLVHAWHGPMSLNMGVEYRGILKDIWQTTHDRLVPGDTPDEYTRVLFGIRDTRTLCSDNELVMWSCNWTNDSSSRFVSLCGSPDKSFLQFRLGQPGAIEVAVPDPGTPPMTVFSTDRFVRNYSAQYLQEGVRYVIDENISSNIDSVVLEVDGEMEFIDCDGTHDQILSLGEFGVD